MPSANAKPENRSRHIFRKAVAGLLLGVTLFALASLISFDPGDLAENQMPPNNPEHNWCGLLGARLAGGLLFWFGGVSVLLAAGGGAWAIAMFLTGDTREPWMKFCGALLLTASACAAAGCTARCSRRWWATRTNRG